MKDRMNMDILQQCINQIDTPISLMTTPTFFKTILKHTNLQDKLYDLTLVGEAFPSEIADDLKDKIILYNEYGPSECAVCATRKQITNSYDISIGRPISNTQIYILDSNHELLPIGIPGELCISGAGVSEGYLNQPSITSEKFIDNPFNPDKKLYKTGDLACWRSDGELFYLGRIDSQVKIRGFRIELEEVESIMNQYDGIDNSAVTVKTDEKGNQYLLGYYIASNNIDEKELRKTLSKKLPHYMVPNYFLKVGDFPMTGSGKIDRKNLPDINHSNHNNEYLKPITPTQLQLCELFSKVLNIESTSIYDNFFELGGDSLSAIELIVEMTKCNINISLQELYSNPTVKELENFYETECSLKETDHKSDEKYNDLLNANVIDEERNIVSRDMGNLFLTGSTGFLGIHILADYLTTQSGIAYCFIRGENENDVKKRLKNVIAYYFGSKFYQKYISRINIILGDITSINLSDNLPVNVDTIIHCAALVKHFGNYDEFKKVNVDGTQNIIQYAKRIHAPLYYISTSSVSGKGVAGELDFDEHTDKILFDERKLYISQKLNNVYIHSKFEAEKCILDAISYGINAHIIRVGNLTNRYSDMMFQPNYNENAFLNRMRAVIELKSIPKKFSQLIIEFSPVDKTAEAINKIASTSAEGYTIFHVYNNGISFMELSKILRTLGKKLRFVDETKFYNMIKESINNKKHIYAAFMNDLNKENILDYSDIVELNNNMTIWYLKKCRFEWPIIDKKYISLYIKYIEKLIM